MSEDQKELDTRYILIIGLIIFFIMDLIGNGDLIGAVIRLGSATILGTIFGYIIGKIYIKYKQEGGDTNG